MQDDLAASERFRRQDRLILEKVQQELSALQQSHIQLQKRETTMHSQAQAMAEHSNRLQTELGRCANAAHARDYIKHTVVIKHMASWCIYLPVTSKYLLHIQTSGTQV